MSLQEELRQSKPFRTVNQEVVVALMYTTDLLKTRFELLLEPYGITSQQYNVLRILRGAGKEGLPTMEIAERMIEKNPGLTRLIDRLEKKKLVARARSEEDRRQVYCTLTQSAVDLLKKLDRPVDHADEEALAGLRDSEARALGQLLEKIRVAL